MMNNKTANIEKVIYFDMDGTVADLYNVTNWLETIRAEKPIFENLPPMPKLDMEYLNRQLIQLQKRGWTISVITWTPMDCTDEYHEFTANEKSKWLDKYMPCVQEFNPLRYGQSKNIPANPEALNIIFDDNKDVRNDWKGIAFDIHEIHLDLDKLLHLPL